METKIIANDLLKVYEKVQKKGETTKEVITVMAWGDPIEVGPKVGDEYPIQVNARMWKNGEYQSIKKNGFVSGKAKFIDPDENEIMKYSVCDVQQGDASVFETPKGTRIFIDTGENQLFARYLAARYVGTTKDKRLPVDVLVFTHCDLDHFGGLLKIEESESNPEPRKRLFIHPKAVFHNGLMTTPSEDPGAAFGRTESKDGDLYVTQLVDDISTLSPGQLSSTYKKLPQLLARWKKDPAIKANGGITIHRLSDKAHPHAFDFLKDEGVDIQILAPLEQEVAGKPALPLLRNPKKTVPEAQGQALDANAELTKGYSASQTINGNSVVLRISYGNIRLLLAGDLNQQSEITLLERCSKEFLRADILKAPHHGSFDFSTGFLECVQPIVSVISSGDEPGRKEYIHPRATLVGSLGKYSRIPQPLIFITELAAFYKYRGKAAPLDTKGKPDANKVFYAHERTSYGIIHFCFNKERVLVFTHSGKRDLKEAYVVTVDAQGKASFSLPEIV